MAVTVLLMTYNLNYANPSFGATLDAIAAAEADLVLLQEVSADWRDALIRWFAAIAAHWHRLDPHAADDRRR
jgi:endonuclease/exonuclease/phosphatase (EEP) superfamily protein YafD